MRKLKNMVRQLPQLGMSVEDNMALKLEATDAPRPGRRSS